MACSICGTWHLTFQKCPPSWEVAVIHVGYTEDGADWYSMRARDAREAAEKAAEQSDQDGDMYLLRSERHEVLVLVRANADAAIERFNVRAESVPRYYATPK